MKWGRVPAISCGIALLLLTGCAPAPGSSPSPTSTDRKGDGMGITQPGLTVENAKRIAQRVENDIVTTFPEGSVNTVDRKTDGILLRCSADRTYSWTGRTTVELTPNTEPKSVIEKITTAYEGDEDLVPEDITNEDVPGVQLNGPHGSGYVVVGRRPGEVTIDMYSPCFVLPDDRSSSARY